MTPLRSFLLQLVNIFVAKLVNIFVAKLVITLGKPLLN